MRTAFCDELSIGVVVDGHVGHGRRPTGLPPSGPRVTPGARRPPSSIGFPRAHRHPLIRRPPCPYRGPRRRHACPAPIRSRGRRARPVARLVAAPPRPRPSPTSRTTTRPRRHHHRRQRHRRPRCRARCRRQGCTAPSHGWATTSPAVRRDGSSVPPGQVVRRRRSAGAGATCRRPRLLLLDWFVIGPMARSFPPTWSMPSAAGRAAISGPVQSWRTTGRPARAAVRRNPAACRRRTIVRLDRPGPVSHHLGVVLLRHVVVVAVKAARRDAGCCGKTMQLVQALVADQVRPVTAAMPPPRFVDQHGHPHIRSHRDRARCRAAHGLDTAGRTRPRRAVRALSRPPPRAPPALSHGHPRHVGVASRRCAARRV